MVEDDDDDSYADDNAAIPMTRTRRKFIVMTKQLYR